MNVFQWWHLNSKFLERLRFVQTIFEFHRWAYYITVAFRQATLSLEQLYPEQEDFLRTNHSLPLYITYFRLAKHYYISTSLNCNASSAKRGYITLTLLSPNPRTTLRARRIHITQATLSHIGVLDCGYEVERSYAEEKHSYIREKNIEPYLICAGHHPQVP